MFDGVIFCDKCHDKVRKASEEHAKNLILESYGTPQHREEVTLKTEDYDEVAQLFKCIGDPSRIEIIELLGKQEYCVFEFVEVTGFQYSTVSYHLKMLKELGLVYSFRRGNFQVYLLTDKGEIVHNIIKKAGGIMKKKKS